MFKFECTLFSYFTTSSSHNSICIRKTWNNTILIRNVQRLIRRLNARRTHYICLGLPEIFISVHVPWRGRAIDKVVVFFEHRFFPNTFGHVFHANRYKEFVGLIEQLFHSFSLYLYHRIIIILHLIRFQINKTIILRLLRRFCG